jgi:hypothetical protein
VSNIISLPFAQQVSRTRNSYTFDRTKSQIVPVFNSLHICVYVYGVLASWVTFTAVTRSISNKPPRRGFSTINDSYKYPQLILFVPHEINQALVQLSRV